MRSSRFGPWNWGGSGGELADAGDGAPGGAVEGVVVGGAVEVHGADLAVGEDGEADEGSALFVERRAGFFGDEGEPGGIDLAEDAAEVGIEVDAHGVGEDVDAGVHALVLDGHAGAVAAALAGLGGVACGLADGIAGSLGGLGEVGPGGRGTGRVDGSLLGGCGFGGDGRGDLRGLLLGWRGLRRAGLGFGGLGLGGAGLGTRCGGAAGGAAAKLLQGLAVEGGVGGLLPTILVAEVVGGAVGELLGEVFGEVEVGQFTVALFEYVGGVDETGLMEENLGAIEDEPADGEPDDDGDVDGLAEAGAGAIVVDLIEEVEKLMGFETDVAA